MRLSGYEAVLSLTLLGMCTLLAACGAGPVSLPTGVSSSSVASTQNPLVAQFTVATVLGCSGQVMVEFGPDTSYGRTTSWYPAAGYYQKSTILVAGMRASTTYHMRALTQCPDSTTTSAGVDQTFTTGPLPAITFPTLTVTRPNPSSTSPENPGVEMVDVSIPGYPALFTDRDANPIWYYEAEAGYAVVPFKLLPNGHILLLIGGPGDSLIREIDLAGNTIRELGGATLAQEVQAAGYDFAPNNFTHDILPLANGHLIVLANFTVPYTDLPGYPGVTNVIGDGLVDLDENWNPVWAWNSFDYLDVNRHLAGLPDWTHSNALVYSASDGNLLLSMRHQSWVLKIDYNNGAGSGNLLWRLGYQGDFSLTNDGVASSDPSLWFSFQHFPSIISQTGSETTLAVWDNGDYRVLDDNGDVCSIVPGSQNFCYSRPVVFQLDDSTMVANVLWADPLQYFGLWGGSINQLANGNVEFDLNDPVVPPAGDVASQVEEITQTPTPQVVWQMAISPSAATAYRAYRFPSLYPGVSWQY